MDCELYYYFFKPTQIQKKKQKEKKAVHQHRNSVYFRVQDCFAVFVFSYVYAFYKVLS